MTTTNDLRCPSSREGEAGHRNNVRAGRPLAARTGAPGKARRDERGHVGGQVWRRNGHPAQTGPLTTEQWCRRHMHLPTRTPSRSEEPL